MENYYLLLFMLNIVLILADASFGYHMAPAMLSGMSESSAVEAGVKTTRRLLSLVVALYMFFNCLGYFQQRLAYLLIVSGLVAVDMTLQYYLGHRRKSGHGADDDE
ncbi:MAG TPA: hypothetical protein PLN25_11040 [Deltaproteobacteria bacterium]|nr:hypothetical protein [Deltaproteobacteria bacterium]HQB39557.1 hypothetical protein [Deltaproteobacteria bacterium]